MDKDFWLARWAQNEIGFHLNCVNPHLQRHFGRLELAAGERVLVPLCGKSLDMAWLAAQGLRVLGVELAPKAVEEFFAEQGLSARVADEGAFVRHAAGGVELWCGDVFALEASQVADCLGWYDRAALIALPAELRERYVTHLSAILPASCRLLLVTLDYDQARMAGPPFAVSAEEVGRLFGGAWQIECLERQEVIGDNPSFVARGLDSLVQSVYLIRRA